MISKENLTSRSRTTLLAAVASVAVAGSIGLGSLTAGTGSVFAEPVKVESLQQMPSFADVVQNVSPAVVSVRVKTPVAAVSDETSGFSFNAPGFDNLPDDHPLKRFFREFRGDRFEGPRSGQRERRHDRRLRPSSQGSGFFISEDGYLVTNNHVIQGGDEYTVVMDDGTEINAELVGTDGRTDLAVLKVEEQRKFTYVAFAEEADIRVGDWVVAVGNPFGLGGTVTAGIVSARGRDIGAGPYDDFIQIDAAVNRGNSGGPAFNLNGEVVGINTAIFSPSGGNVGIAFAIPSTTAKGVVEELIKNGTVSRGWLGVQIQPVTEDIAESLGLQDTKGALVSEPQPDGPAQAAGVEAGDVIMAVNGQPVASPKELARLIGGLQPNAAAKVTVWRDGKSRVLDVNLGEMPGAEQRAAVEPAAPDTGEMLEGFGLTVARADDGNGVVVTDVEPGSDAEERGLEVGDVIVKVNSVAVSSVKDVEKAVSDASKGGRKAVLVQIERDQTNRFVALPVAKG
jgi:serine protease Do